MLIADSGCSGPRIRFVVLVVIDRVGRAVLAVVRLLLSSSRSVYVTLKADDKSLAGERHVAECSKQAGLPGP